MAGTSSSNQKSTSTVQLPSYANTASQDIIARASQAGLNPNAAQPFDFSLNQGQQAGINQQMGLGQMLQQMNLGQPGFQLGNSMLAGDYLHPSSNPYLAETIKAATDPIMKNFQESILPSIQSSAIQQGAFGGDREGITSALAGSEAMRNIGNVSSQIAYQNYGQERQNQLQTPDFLSQLLGVAQAPGALQSSAGDAQQAAQLAQYQENLQAPFRPLIPFAQLLSGVPLETTTTTKGKASASQFDPAQIIRGGAGLAALLMMP